MFMLFKTFNEESYTHVTFCCEDATILRLLRFVDYGNQVQGKILDYVKITSVRPSIRQSACLSVT
jgi:hypothetical protein